MFKHTDRLDQLFILIGSLILIIIAYPFLLNTLPQFNDLITSAYSGGNSINKDYELFLIKSLIFLNVVVCSFYCFKVYKYQKQATRWQPEVREHLLNKNDFISFFLISLNLVYFIGTGNVQGVLRQLLLVWFVSLYYEHRLGKGEVEYLKSKVIFLYFVVKLIIITCLMVLQSLFSIGILDSPYLSINYSTIITEIGTIIIYIALLIYAFNKDTLDKIIVNTQLILPITILNLLANFYTINNSVEIYYKAPPTSYIVLVIGLTLVFAIFQVKNKRKYTKVEGELSLNSIVTISTLCIFALYIGTNITNYDFRGDLWHYGERLVPYQQATEFSKKLYSEFYPSSGLYSYVTAFPLDKFFNNEYFNLNYAFAFRNIITLLTFTVLISKVCGKFETFLIILLFFTSTEYERPILLVPFFYLLCLQKIKKDEIIWLSVWALGCLFSILYYPLYGAAIAVGTLPWAIYIARQLYFKYKEKVEITNLKPKIALFVFSCFVVLMFLPLMLRELYSIAQFSKQTVMVDSMTIIRNGTNIRYPKYLANERLNNAVYQIMIVYLLVIVPSLVFSYIPRVCILLKNNSENEPKKKVQYTELLFAFICVFVVISIAYSYTLIRMDTNYFLARSTSLFLYMIGFIFIYALVKLLDVSGKKSIFDALNLAILISVILFSSFSANFNGLGTKVGVRNYDESFVEYENPEMPNLGSGMIRQSDLDQLLKYKDYIDKFDTSVMFYTMSQGYFYLFNIESTFVSAGTFVAARDMQEYYLEKSLDSMPNVIFGDGQILTNYYLTKSFIDMGYVYFKDDTGQPFFMKGDFFESFYTDEEKARFTYNNLFYLHGRSAYFWGKSLDAIVEETIEQQSTNIENLTIADMNKTTYQDGVFTIESMEDPQIIFELDEPISGFDNDVIYLEMEVYATDGNFADDSFQIFYASEGEVFEEEKSIFISGCDRVENGGVKTYLIPIGTSVKYLTSDIKYLRLDGVNMSDGSTIKINKFDFYRYPSHEVVATE